MQKSFIEVQFPISKLTKESYKERKAGASQTLTRLGKWWGRKPLVLMRACIIGLLIPASDNPEKDNEIFLKIMTMDEEGLLRRKNKSIGIEKLIENISNKDNYFELKNNKYAWKKGITKEEKIKLEEYVFNKMGYDEKLTYCLRPEQIDGPSKEAWIEINKHLNTNANNLQELICELGIKRLGHIPKIGDCFCGGGSTVFEAYRLGCEVFGSDLNPVAILLTWSAINLLCASKEVKEKIKKRQCEIFDKADKQILEWGIETNELGWRADAFLYCFETISPSSGYLTPLAPSFIISEKKKIVAHLIPDHINKRFNIEIVENASKELYGKASKGTVQSGRFIDPITNEEIDIKTIRGDKKGADGKTIYGLRLWENDDIVPRKSDVFQERLYCIRYMDEKGVRHYVTPTEDDLKREALVLQLLKERFYEWQNKGYIPNKKIEEGVKTNEVIMERGWTHWHHLFNPRQLLYHGLLMNLSGDIDVVDCLSNMRMDNWDSRLTHWNMEGVHQVFYNQAFNTLYTYACRGFNGLEELYNIDLEGVKEINGKNIVKPMDARDVSYIADYWITDPPYADAINYHELSEFFLAWIEKHIPKVFPDWYVDSKRILAVRGSGDDFKKSMVDIYKNLTKHMPDDGMQVVMFTHQDASVWADLGMILWAAGLKVTAAWVIGTETSSGLKTGNYVQGTVFIILRKRTDEKSAFLDEIYLEVDDEVKNQLKSMMTLDNKEEPNFSDTDYQLAAYASALRVLTKYSKIEGNDVTKELFKERKKGEKSDFEKMIDKAVETACGYLIPDGFNGEYWKILKPIERFYIKGLEFEMHKEARAGAYQELAKGFSVREYRKLLATGVANMVRLKCPLDFKRSMISGGEFGDTLLRHILLAIYISIDRDSAAEGLNYLKAEIKDYWSNRKLIQEVLSYFMKTSLYSHMKHWHSAANFAELLKGLIENDRG
jgi:adenine-specific DNA methylase